MATKSSISLCGLQVFRVCILVIAGCSQLLAQESQRLSAQEELAARRRDKATRLEEERVSTWEARVLSLEEANFPSNIFVKGFNGFRPVIGGMPAGSGFVGGLGWGYGLESERYGIDATATYSTRGFRQLSARLELSNAPNRIPISGFVTVAYQNYPGLRSFGVGNNSDRGDRTFFGQKNRVFGGGVTVELSRFLKLQADVSRLAMEVGPGNRDPSVQGPGSDTTFRVYGAEATFSLTDRYGFPPVGLQIVVGAQRYDDRNRQLSSFVRVAGEIRGQVPLGYRNRRLAFRVRTSNTASDEGHSVPFYLMETVGGAGSLRGYDEYRFRDLRSLLFTAEYRWEVWTYLDLAVFYDAGKVFEARRDMNFRNMHSGYGMGVRLRAPDDVAFNVDLSHSREGFKLHMGSSRRF